MTVIVVHFSNSNGPLQYLSYIRGRREKSNVLLIKNIFLLFFIFLSIELWIVFCVNESWRVIWPKVDIFLLVVISNIDTYLIRLFKEIFTYKYISIKNTGGAVGIPTAPPVVYNTLSSLYTIFIYTNLMLFKILYMSKINIKKN